jgi:transcriptional regulator with XRE-family HTH domain
MATLGERIHERRKELNLTISEVIDRCWDNHQYVLRDYHFRQIEAGFFYPKNYRKLEAIATALELKVTELIEGVYFTRHLRRRYNLPDDKIAITPYIQDETQRRIVDLTRLRQRAERGRYENVVAQIDSELEAIHIND